MDQQNNFEQIQPGVGTGKGFSIAALVLGIIGVVFGFISVINFVALPCALLGLIFGVIGRIRSKSAFGKASGIATAGFVLGIIGTSFAALGVVCTVAVIGTAVSCFG